MKQSSYWPPEKIRDKNGYEVKNITTGPSLEQSITILRHIGQKIDAPMGTRLQQVLKVACPRHYKTVYAHMRPKQKRSVRVHEKVRRKLGHVPIFVPEKFMQNICDQQACNKKTGYYRTMSAQYQHMKHWLSKHNINVDGHLCDPCCGRDERAAYNMNKYFARASQLSLSDKPNKLGDMVDLTDIEGLTTYCSDKDWAVTSTPYESGPCGPKTLKALVSSPRRGAVVKLSVSATATRVGRGEWWNSHKPSHILVMDPVAYPGFYKENSKGQLTPKENPSSEAYMVWQRGWAGDTKYDNIATLYA